MRRQMHTVRTRREGDIDPSIHKDLRAAQGKHGTGEFELLSRGQILLADLNPIDAIADHAGHGVEKAGDLPAVCDIISDHRG